MRRMIDFVLNKISDVLLAIAIIIILAYNYILEIPNIFISIILLILMCFACFPISILILTIWCIILLIKFLMNYFHKLFKKCKWNKTK